jgi:hypothetical protein
MRFRDMCGILVESEQTLLSTRTQFECTDSSSDEVQNFAGFYQGDRDQTKVEGTIPPFSPTRRSFNSILQILVNIPRKTKCSTYSNTSTPTFSAPWSRIFLSPSFLLTD